MQGRSLQRYAGNSVPFRRQASSGFVNRRKVETHSKRSKQTSGEYKNKATIPGVIKQYYLILPYNYLVQLTAAAGQNKQLRKTSMNDCSNFMNEDKRIYIPKGSKKNPKKQSHNARPSRLSSSKWPITLPTKPTSITQLAARH